MRYLLLLILAVGVASAQQQQGEGAGSLLSLLLPIILLVGVFYLFIILPQSRERKKKQRMLDTLARGNRVVTIGGIVGVVSQVDEKHVVLRVAEGVTVKLEKWAIQKVLSGDEG